MHSCGSANLSQALIILFLKILEQRKRELNILKKSSKYICKNGKKCYFADFVFS